MTMSKPSARVKNTVVTETLTRVPSDKPVAVAATRPLRLPTPLATAIKLVQGKMEGAGIDAGITVYAESVVMNVDLPGVYGAALLTVAMLRTGHVSIAIQTYGNALPLKRAREVRAVGDKVMALAQDIEKAFEGVDVTGVKG